MDCLQAQQVISDALDKVPVDDVSVEKAKLHCTGCPECNSFVRAIASTMRAAMPEPDPELPDRVMAAIRADMEAQAIQRAATAARSSASDREGAADQPETRTDNVVRLGDSARRRTLIAWGSAAAVVLIAAGMFANQGVRQILTPTDATLMDSRTGIPAQQESAVMAPSTQNNGVAGTQESGVPSVAPAAAPDNYIEVDGTAYKQAGAVPDVDRAALNAVGSTTSSLASGGAATQHKVLAGTQDPSRVYIALPDGTLTAFDRVTREYRGALYALKTGSIESFGIWPTYPSGVGKPTSDDGKPVFRELGPDTTGATLFEPLAGGATIGIAVGPGSPSSDPAQGNPDWTWWAPVR